MANNVYNSSTLGPLPLSQKGKDLMQTLRFAQQYLIRDAQLYTSSRLNWDEVSRARGEIVRYIGELEKGLEGKINELQESNERLRQSQLEKELAAIRSVDDSRVRNLQQDKAVLQKKVDELKEENGRLHVAMQVTAQMSTPLGLLPINSTGMRKLVDELGRLQEQVRMQEGVLDNYRDGVITVKTPLQLGRLLSDYTVDELHAELAKRAPESKDLYQLTLEIHAAVHA